MLNEVAEFSVTDGSGCRTSIASAMGLKFVKIDTVMSAANALILASAIPHHFAQLQQGAVDFFDRSSFSCERLQLPGDVSALCAMVFLNVTNLQTWTFLPKLAHPLKLACLDISIPSHLRTRALAAQLLCKHMSCDKSS